MIRLLPVLIALSCCLAPPAWAEQKYESHLFGSNFCHKSPDEPIFIGPEIPDGLPEINHSEPIPEMLTDKLPLARIRSASYPGGGSQERDYAWLVLVTLMAHQKIVAHYREFLVTEGASETLLAVFDKAAAWREDVCAREPTEAYLHYKKLYEHESDDPVVRQYFSWVANYISMISLSRFSPVAHYDAAMNGFDDPEQIKDYCNTESAVRRSYMRKAGALNYVSAVKEMIRRSLDLGNRAEAYFWMLRAKKRGLNVDDDIQALKPKLTERDRSYLAKWDPNKDISSLGKVFHDKDFRKFMKSFPGFWDEKDILCRDHRAN
ncbi:MAG: hypothetical protein ISR47_03680 [Rhodospirillales bacterium]|nr:hypothetical protein [Rhodospirillales bacterium]